MPAMHLPSHVRTTTGWFKIPVRSFIILKILKMNLLLLQGEMTIDQRARQKIVISLERDAINLKNIKSLEKARCTVTFTGHVQEESGLLGIAFDLSQQQLHDALSMTLCKADFEQISFTHRIGFVPVGDITTYISLSTHSDHASALSVLKLAIDQIKLIIGKKHFYHSQ